MRARQLSTGRSMGKQHSVGDQATDSNGRLSGQGGMSVE